MAERASKIFAMTSHSILEGAGLARESGHERIVTCRGYITEAAVACTRSILETFSPAVPPPKRTLSFQQSVVLRNGSLFIVQRPQ